MPRTATIPIRFEEPEREALERAANSDDRSMSALARKIVVEWLRTNGHLGDSARVK
jgi:hypothetical protein